MQYSLGVSWIAVAETNGSAPSEDSRKHKFAVGVDSPLRRSKEFGQEARVTSVYLMRTGPEAEPEAEPEAGHSTAPRRGSLAERAMRCSLLGSGIGEQAVILGVFKPVCLEGQSLRFTSLSDASLNGRVRYALKITRFPVNVSCYFHYPMQ